MTWLKEMEVIEAVRIYLETRSFKINRVVSATTEHGTDIVATSPDERVATHSLKAQNFRNVYPAH